VKYCSEKTYDLLENIAKGKDINDLDFDMYINLTGYQRKKDDITQKSLENQFKKTLLELEDLYQPQGISTSIVNVSNSLTDIPDIEISRTIEDWQKLKISRNGDGYYLYSRDRIDEIKKSELIKLEKALPQLKDNPKLAKEVFKQKLVSERTRAYEKIVESKGDAAALAKLQTELEKNTPYCEKLDFKDSIFPPGFTYQDVMNNINPAITLNHNIHDVSQRPQQSFPSTSLMESIRSINENINIRARSENAGHTIDSPPENNHGTFADAFVWHPDTDSANYHDSISENRQDFRNRQSGDEERNTSSNRTRTLDQLLNEALNNIAPSRRGTHIDGYNGAV
jgi:hypothetical protein